MKDVRGTAAANDLVSIADRMRYMQIFRVALTVAVLSFRLTMPGVLGAPWGDLATGILAFLGLSLAAEVVWRVFRSEALFVFGGMLFIDGIYLAWLMYLTGGSFSLFRYFILLHLIAVALLASYRTSLKLSLWHSLLLLFVFHAQEAGILEPIDKISATLPGTEFQRLIAFTIVFWLVALATSTLAAVNERELRRRRYDLERFSVMTSEMEHATDGKSVGDVLIDSLVDAFGYRRAVVLADRPGQPMLLAHRGVESPSMVGDYPQERSLIVKAMIERETLMVSHLDPASDPWLCSLLPGARNLVIVPLTTEGTSIGVLVAENAFRKGSRIERRVVSMTERFAAHAALALQNAWLLDEVRQMAATDGLTLVGNRRSFDDHIDRELSRAQRTSGDVSLIMIDIDHFKTLNDKHGHQTGDEVLREVAQVIKSTVRDYDTVARYGGEEFGAILPGCDAVEAAEIAERVRVAIQTCGSTVPVTASAGIATFPGNAIDKEALVTAADEALYESKRAGRNRVTTSDLQAMVLPSTASPGELSKEALGA